MSLGARMGLEWLPTEADGSGVIVGIVEPGVDCGNPEIVDAVRMVWDRHASPGGYGEPHPDGGTILRETECHLATGDGNGHGTAMAALIAGRRNVQGVAPGCDLAVVCTPLGDASIGPAVEWIFDQAEDRGMPAVVNLSFAGSHNDAHDGSDALSVEIDSLSGPGRIICVAAGNDGNLPLHASLHLHPGEVQSLPVVVTCSADGRHRTGGGPGIMIASSGAAPYRYRVVAWDPRGGRRSSATEFQGREARSESEIGGYRLQRAAQHRAAPTRNLASLEFVPLDEQVIERSTLWWLDFEAEQTGTIDLWATDPQVQFRDFRQAAETPFPPASQVADEMLLARPAAARRVVTVGAYADRSPEPPVICSFSNPGPTADGRRKPEAASPGHNVDVGALLGSHTGTSPATALMTGRIALLLQQRRDLTVETILSLLAQTSSPPSGRQGWDKRWGNGTVDFQALWNEIRNGR